MTRTFVLGIDGGSWRILNDLDLPAFEQLAKRGTTGHLRSSLPPITYPAWKCYSTGKNPGKLGVFGFINFDRDQKENRQNDATHFDSAEVWDYLSDEGRRVGVVNMPTTYPPHQINGIMISGPNSGESEFVEPPAREQEIKNRGYIPMSNGHRLALQSGGETTVSAAKELIKSRFDISRQLLTEDEYDFFNLTIYCTDPIQHHFWGKSEVEQTYQCLDTEFRTLLEQLERDDTEWNVVVVSDHGFRSITGALYVDTWLEKRGFLEKNSEPDAGKSMLNRVGVTEENVVRMVRALGLERLVGRLPDTFTSAVKEGLPSEGRLPVVDLVNWNRSDAVFLMGGIYVLNQQRREVILDDLEGALRSFTIDDNHVFDEVYRTDEEYTGPYTELAPDLIPLSNDYKLLGFSENGLLFDPSDDWIAAHEMDGVFIGSGPSFECKSGVKLDIYDVAPTILHVMGSPVPSDVTGLVCQDILSGPENIKYRNPLKTGTRQGASGEDRERLKANLRQLGYLE